MIDEMFTLAVVACDCRSFALRPCLLRANVIKSPITNASLQASAAAGCYVGAALAGVCFRAPSWMSSCRRNSAEIFFPSRCSIDAISLANCVHNHCL